MMALRSSGQGPLKAVMLAGIFLSCALQLVQAQNRFFVTKEPEHPNVGQRVTLIPRGVPGHITLCQWFRESTSEPSGEILSFTQFHDQDLKSSLDKNHQNSNGSGYTGRETLHPNCSLQIQKLTPQDTGNYTVQIETIAQQSGQTADTKNLEGFIYLQIKVPAQRIDITADPRFPKQGQNVTLTPQVNFRQFTFCEWSVQTRSGHSKVILRQIPEQVEQVDSEYKDRVTVGDACLLQIRQVKTTDANNYTVTIRAPSQHPQWPQQSGQKDHSQGERDQEYRGFVYLNVAEPHTGPKGGSASLSYSAGVIAGGLFGSLAWADSLMSLFSVLLSSLASWRSKLFV